jgi:preprotein translocase subunit YajC
MNNCYLFCNAASAAPAAEAQAVETQSAGGEAAPAPAGQSPFGMMLPMLLILAIFYFMMIRPQQRKEKERRKMIDELRAGAQIIFAGGLKGTITEAKEQFFMVEIAPGTVIEVARSAVQSVISAEGGEKR